MLCAAKPMIFSSHSFVFCISGDIFWKVALIDLFFFAQIPVLAMLNELYWVSPVKSLILVMLQVWIKIQIQKQKIGTRASTGFSLNLTRNMCFLSLSLLHFSGILALITQQKSIITWNVSALLMRIILNACNVWLMIIPFKLGVHCDLHRRYELLV